MDIKTLVDEWLRLDKNPKTRAEIEALWKEGNEAELQARLGSRIEFGTAGLRGRMEAGFARMNDLTIIQASQGLCAYMLETIPNAQGRGIVVGHDHRHNSERWARITTAVFLDSGVKVYLHRGLVHTPLVPFSVKCLGASGGVMITASHNPKDDNGYKVYWENGVQIISPHDQGIATFIQTNLEPRNSDFTTAQESPLLLDKTNEMREAYFTQLFQLSRTSSINSSSSVKFVCTAMHGVGHSFAVQAFQTFKLPPFEPVKEQQSPNPDFPTVQFPNPEEKGALDLAIKTADNIGADYVLAQDPDADRFAAAERQPNGSWLAFSGDQLGTLFAAWIFQAYKESGKPIDALAMVASTVSSKMVESMAQKEGFKFAECLTGFKYIGNTALDLVKAGFIVPFGYEEAIGYMIGNDIRDKDGIAATVTFAELINYLRGKDLLASSYLNQLYDKYGFFQTRNSYFICRDTSKIDKIFSRLRKYNNRSSGPDYPLEIGSLKVVHVRDLTVGHAYDSSTLSPELPLSTGHMITFKAQEDAPGESKIILTIRTSGTEPKIKYYLEGSGRDRVAIKRLLDRVVRDLKENWMEAELNGLGEP